MKLGKSIIPLRKCHFCGREVRTAYLENRRYRYECIDCGKYVEFNAKSQLEADKQFNNTVHSPCKVGDDIWSSEPFKDDKMRHEEIADINAMQPEDNENEITVEVKKMHYITECKIIINRIAEFIYERGRVDNE